MKKTLITAAILILSGSAFAQYVGPSSAAAPVTSVQQLLKNGKDDQYATSEVIIMYLQTKQDRLMSKSNKNTCQPLKLTTKPEYQSQAS